MQEHNNKPLKIKELNVKNNYNDLTNQFLKASCKNPAKKIQYNIEFRSLY